MASERIGDSQERIDKCLNCDKYRCTNCYDMRKSKGVYGRVSETAFMEMYQSGYTDSEMAKELNLSYTTIRSYRIRRGLEANRKGEEPCKVN